MAQAKTLMAYLVPRLTSRGEDTATDALAFILNRSEECREGLNRLLRNCGLDLAALTRFETQVTYKDGSRPDMAGYDQEGRKRLLVEAKFWASLQPGQASGYYTQLEEEGPGLLMFIAPRSRLATLWASIGRQMDREQVELEPSEAAPPIRISRIAGTDKHLILMDWSSLLNVLADAAASDSLISSDIQQLRGLCQQEDDGAFLPINTAELGPALARRIPWLNRLVDDIVDSHGVAERWMSTENLRATSQRDGYGRYFRFRRTTGHVFTGDRFLCVDFQLWATRADTPLWLKLWNINADRLRQRFPLLAENCDRWNGCGVPIFLTTGEEYERVMDDAVTQVKEVGKVLHDL